jgi:hypothetical protein
LPRLLPALDVALNLKDKEADTYKQMDRNARIAWWARRGFAVDPPEPTELERTPWRLMPPRPPKSSDEKADAGENDDD